MGSEMCIRDRYKSSRPGQHLSRFLVRGPVPFLYDNSTVLTLIAHTGRSHPLLRRNMFTYKSSCLVYSILFPIPHNSSSGITAILRAELEKHPLEASRDVRTLKGQPKVRNMPKKRLPAIADRAVLEEVTKVPAGIRWDSVVEKVWMDRGGNQQEVMSVLREVCGVREWNKRNDSNKGKANANQQGEGGATLEAFTGG